MPLPIYVIPQNSNHTVIPLVFKVSSVPQDVTGATLTARLRRSDTNPPGAGFAATGTVAVVAGNNGALTYQPSLADTATLGEYELQVKGVWADTTIEFADLYFFTVAADV